MRLSDLQRYILKQIFVNGPKTHRGVFMKFYKKKTDDEVKIITRSLERLITKGLLIGYGHKTAEKLFIEKVSLTPTARRIAKKLVHDQQQLPLKIAKRKRL